MDPVAKVIALGFRGLRNFAKFPSERRLLLYQMGKVGSSAVSESLCERGMWVLHTHSLNATTLAERLRAAIKVNETPPPSTVHGYAIARCLPNLAEDELRVVTLVRDPIARDLSVFFQDLSLSDAGKRLLERGDYAAIRAEYLANNTLNYTLGWFDFELNRFLGVDVYATPFDPEKGTAVYRNGTINLILLKSELDAHAKVRALSRWLDIDSLSIRRSNVSREKTYGHLYRRFVAAVQLPDSLVEEAIDSRFTRHFYSAHERTEMAVRWTTGASRS